MSSPTGAIEKLRGYLDIYGPEGEFNESAMSANANAQPVQFFAALSCHAGGDANPLTRHPFPALCRWVMHATDPSGHRLPFGDSPRAGSFGWMRAHSITPPDGMNIIPLRPQPTGRPARTELRTDAKEDKGLAI